MQSPAGFTRPPVGYGINKRRRFKGLAFLKPVLRSVGIDTSYKPKVIIRIHFKFKLKIPAPGQLAEDDIALVLRRRLVK